jgi:hypothetical protein
MIDDCGFRIAAGIKVTFVNIFAKRMRVGQESAGALFWQSAIFYRSIIELMFLISKGSWLYHQGFNILGYCASRMRLRA